MKLIGTCGPVVSVFGPLQYDAGISMLVYSLSSDKQKTCICDMYQCSEMFWTHRLLLSSIFLHVVSHVQLTQKLRHYTFQWSWNVLLQHGIRCQNIA